MKKIFLFFTFVLALFASNDFLMPDEAFQVKAKVIQQSKIKVDIQLASTMYLYKDRVNFKILDEKNILIKNIEYPQSEIYHNEKVYLKSPTFILSIKSKHNSIKNENLRLEVSYQGCSQAGLCYEPLTKIFNLKLNTNTTTHNAPAPLLVQNLEKTSQIDSITTTMQESNIFVILLTFFGFGLLLSLTPCVFPMIPIISGLIISQGKNITTMKAFSLSLTYVISMSIAYTFAGILAGLFGANLQATLQNPFVIYSFSAIFIALALSMFGFYELKLPDSIVNKVSKNRDHSGYIGIAIMGFLSALIVGPCVAAPLAGALVYIGQTGDALLGGMALFSMSLGMGIPLIFVGISAGKFMPKPGSWMTFVNITFGVIMLGVAIWMLNRVLDISVIISLTILLLISFASYIYSMPSKHFLLHSLMLVLYTYSIALFIGLLSANYSFLHPLKFSISNNKNLIEEEKLSFTTIYSIDELNAILDKKHSKKILLDFSAKWCVSCEELDKFTFTDPQVKKILKDFILIRADLTKNSLEGKMLSKKYGVFGPPVILFFDENSNLIKSKTLVGFIKAKPFLKHLQGI